MRKFLLVILTIFMLNSCAYALTWDFTKVQDTPNSLQIKADYLARTDGQPIYLCYSPKTTSTAIPDWMCFKFTYDGNNQMTVKQTALDTSYDNRATATYN